MGAWHITAKDLRLLIRDRRALAILVVLPLIFITILGASTGQLLGWRDENQVLRIAVVDNVDYDSAGERAVYIDDIPLKQKNAHRLVDQFIAALDSRDGIRVEVVDDVEAAETRIREGDANAAVFVGADFFQNVDQLSIGDVLDADNGRLAEGLAGLDIRLQGRSSISSTSSIVEQLVLSDAVRTIAPYVACKNNAARLQLRSTCRLYESLDDPPPEPVTTEPPPSVATEGPGGRIVYQEIVPSYTVMFVFFLVNVMGRSFIQERELGTLRRLRMAPITAWELLAGKTVPFFLISLAQTAVLFLSGRALFGMSWGPQPLWLIPVIVCTSLAATGLGLLLSTYVRTDSQVSAYGNFLVIIMAGISGCFMPRDWLPETMQQVSLGTPHAWSLMAYYELLSTDHPVISAVLGSCGMLLVFAALFFLAGWRQFRRSEFSGAA